MLRYLGRCDVMKVIIVDDQDIMLQGLSMILSKDEAIEIVGLAGNGQDAISLCEKHKVDVVLMDINMPIMNGVEATKIICDSFKETRVLILTTFNDDEFIFGSLKNGASGYLLKDASPGEIIGAIKTVYAGGTFINPAVATKVVQKLSSNDHEQVIVDQRAKDLTGRELDICHLLGEGYNNKEIGDELFISEGTVKNNITRILDKLDLRDRTQLALFAVKNRL